jgi:hypothetical protein
MTNAKTDETLEPTPLPAAADVPVEPKNPTEALKELALSPGLQSLWAAILPMVGVRASRPDEFAGYFQVEPGTAPNEALVHIDIPNAPYAEGAKPTMARVVSLSVKLAHDFRRLGDQYFCIDCEVPAEETRH